MSFENMYISKLERQLEIATSALYQLCSSVDGEGYHIADQALKQIEEIR